MLLTLCPDIPHFEAAVFIHRYEMISIWQKQMDIMFVTSEFVMDL